METAPLRAAYDEFFAVAGREPQGIDQHGWSAPSIVAHVTINNRLIAAHVARILEGEPRPYDNIPTQNDRLLRAVVNSGGDWSGLLEAARLSSEEVLDLVEAAPDEAGTTQQHFLILEGDHALLDDEVSVAQVVKIQTQVHLPSHTEQLLNLV